MENVDGSTYYNVPARLDSLMVGDEVWQLLIEGRRGVDVDRVAETQGAVCVGSDPLVAVGDLVWEPGCQGATDVGQFPKFTQIRFRIIRRLSLSTTDSLTRRQFFAIPCTMRSMPNFSKITS